MLSTILKSQFNQSVAFSEYSKWAATNNLNDFESAVLAAVPLVNKVISKSFAASILEYDELRCVALAAIVEDLRSLQFKGSSEENYKAYLINRLRTALVRASRRELNTSKYIEIPFPQPRFPRSRDVEVKVFLEDLPRRLTNEFKKRNRFSGDERKACNLFLKHILQGNIINPNLVSSHYKLSTNKTKFLLDYTIVSIRIILRKMIALEGGSVLDDWNDLCDLYTPESIE